jgi:hypothetical protein
MHADLPRLELVEFGYRLLRVGLEEPLGDNVRGPLVQDQMDVADIGPGIGVLGGAQLRCWLAE